MFLVEPWVVWGLASAVAVYMLRVVYSSFNTTERQRRAMRRLPAPKLSDVAPGATVMIRGRIDARGALLQSPLERQECCAYRLMVWDASQDDQKLVLDESKFCDLDVEADGVAASIRAQSIMLEGRGDVHYSGSGDHPTGAQALIVERHDLDPTRLIYTEYVLRRGDVVTLIAKVSSVEDGSLDDARFVCAGSGGYRSMSRRRVLVAEKFPVTVIAPGGQL